MVFLCFVWEERLYAVSETVRSPFFPGDPSLSPSCPFAPSRASLRPSGLPHRSEAAAAHCFNYGYGPVADNFVVGEAILRHGVSVV